MKKFFKIEERNSSIPSEILAGFTTFVAMLYIVVVNPAILSEAGMDFGGVFMATILVTMIGTLIMGLFANYPIAISTGMGINAFFAYTVVLGQGVSWQTALGSIFVAGIVFTILSLTKFRQVLIDQIPSNLKHSITAGIGLFIAFIGLQQSGIIVDSKATLVTLGSLSNPMVLLTLFGLISTIVLMMYKVKGATFIGMLATAILALITGVMDLPSNIVSLPTGIETTAFQLDIKGVFEHSLYGVIFTFLLVTLFDTTGTMIGITEQMGLNKGGKFKNSKSALLADSIATTSSSLLGTSPTTAFIESGSGVSAGGRTGLTSVVVAILFGLTLFFMPIAQMLASIPAITSPALIIVGFLMISTIKNIEWNNIEDGFPAFLLIVSMPLTYSISNGIGLGFISYVILKLINKKGKEIHPILYLIALLFIVQLVLFNH